MTITELQPAAGAQGALLSILGAGLAGCTLVKFAGLGRETTIAPSYVSEGEVRVYVPSFDGVGGLVLVSAVSDDAETSALAFDLAAYPAVEAPYRLVSLAALKTALGVAAGETFADEKYLAMIDAASATIARECRLDFRPVVVVGELGDGDGSAIHELRRGPVRSVQAVRILGTAIDLAEVKVYSSYIGFEDSGEWEPRLRSTGRIFPAGRRNVSVDYTAGYTAIPFDVSFECIQQVVFIQNTLTKAGVTSETSSVSQNATTYAQVPLAPSVKRMCNRYRPTRVAVI